MYEALGMDRAARGWRGLRLVKGQDQQESRVEDAWGEARSGSHSGLAPWTRVWGMGRISGKLSRGDK